MKEASLQIALKKAFFEEKQRRSDTGGGSGNPYGYSIISITK
jgi:hypothetical protein